ncbi:MAG: hypothetical protein CMK07_12955 [Ponticaulis sp.]|nr:hypothetical protein [Ponticaulis sp.]
MLKTFAGLCLAGALIMPTASAQTFLDNVPEETPQPYVDALDICGRYFAWDYDAFHTFANDLGFWGIIDIEFEKHYEGRTSSGVQFDSVKNRIVRFLRIEAVTDPNEEQACTLLYDGEDDNLPDPSVIATLPFFEPMSQDDVYVYKGDRGYQGVYNGELIKLIIFEYGDFYHSGMTLVRKPL